MSDPTLFDMGADAPRAPVRLSVFVESRREGFCESCHAPIVWFVLQSSKKWHPFNPPAEPTEIALVGDDVRVGRVPGDRSHFATCPNAEQHRRRKRGGA